MRMHAPLWAAGYLMVHGVAMAAPSDYVYTPTVEYGEREIDFKYGSAAPRDGDPHQSAWSLGLGYGVKEWWFTEMYIKYKRASDLGTRYDAVEWENKFQLTETGRYPVDVGLLLEIERPTNRAEGWEFKWGPLLQAEFGKLQLNGNVLLERSYRTEAAAETVLQYQWQAKYRWKPQLELGLQGFGEVGQWDRWEAHSDRSHQLGPAIFGKLRLGGRQAIRYNAALLVGTSQAAPDRTFRTQIEYEF